MEIFKINITLTSTSTIATAARRHIAQARKCATR